MGRRTTGKLYTSGKKGHYYFRYIQSGKEFRTRLLDLAGNPITRKPEAQEAAARILKPIMETDRAEQYRLIQNNIRDAENAAEIAQVELINSKARISAGWELYMSCPKRLKSCKQYDAEDIPKNSTTAYYRSYYQHFADWMNTKYPDVFLLSNLTKEHIIRFGNELRKQTAPGTFNKYRFFLISFYSALAEDKKINVVENPFNALDREDISVNSRRELSIDELNTIIDRATGDLKLLLQVGTFTGLRLGDCCTLQWGEIDLRRLIIRRKPRKTAKKTQKIVTIGLPSILFRALDSIPTTKRNGYLFPRYAEMYLLPHGPGKVTRIIQSHFKTCGIEVHAPGTGMKYHYEGKQKIYDKSKRAIVQVGFHSLRHTWVSLHAMRGTPQAIIQDTAGHANPAMTEHYTHVSIEAAQRAAAALEIPQLGARPDMIDVTAEAISSMEPERQQLLALIPQLPMKTVRDILNLLSSDSD